MKKQIENIIKENLPPSDNSSKILSFGKGFNQALSQINTSLIADEVLKVVVEKITKDILDEIEQYIVSAKAIKINKQQADFVYWYDVKLAIKRLLSNLSPNKENDVVNKITVPICIDCHKPHFGRSKVEDRCICDTVGRWEYGEIDEELLIKENENNKRD